MQQIHEQHPNSRPGIPSEPRLPVGTQHRQGMRTASIIVQTVLIVVIFGIGLFSGWVFGTRNSGSGQPVPHPMATAPAVTTSGQALDALREAVVEQVRPTVVQVNVVTSSGEGLGSGVILDSRGSIVTNNHVVSGAQRRKQASSPAMLSCRLGHTR